MAVARLTVTVVVRAESKGSAAMTAGYRGNDNGGNLNNSKGNSDENGERGSNNGGGISHLSLLSSLFLVRLRTRSRGLFFCLIHNCHVMTQTKVRLYT